MSSDDSNQEPMKTKLVIDKQWLGNMLKLTYRIGEFEREAYLIISPDSRRIIRKTEPNWN